MKTSRVQANVPPKRLAATPAPFKDVMPPGEQTGFGPTEIASPVITAGLVLPAVASDAAQGAVLQVDVDGATVSAKWKTLVLLQGVPAVDVVSRRADLVFFDAAPSAHH
jgi:hypothetical protein